MKYRIVKRLGKTYCYFAQKKVLWWWVDLPTISLCNNLGETPSHSQKLVENYIEHIIGKKEIVVKKYE